MNPVQFFKCLADDTRLRSLLLILREEELCVCEISSALAQSQPKISRHLAQLRQCGLLQDRRQAQWVFYRVTTDLPHWQAKVLRQTLQDNSTYIQQDLQRLQNMGNRPDREALCC
jgi:ArsR family transcriptional regulator